MDSPSMIRPTAQVAWVSVIFITYRSIGLAAAGACLLIALTAGPAGAAVPVASQSVTFQVVNTNTSGVSCVSDGAPYTVHGHLVGPRARLAGGPTTAVTLYYHGLSYGEFFWDFKAVQGYDFSARLARAGQVSLVVDRLGYGASGRPPGMMSCYGSQADVAHQIVGKLRTGGYTDASGQAPKFGKVILAGHSGSGYTVEIEAYSYKDVDGLIEAGFSDGGASPLAISNAGKTQLVCAQGGQQSDGASGPGGYAYFGQTDQDFQGGSFFDADPSVVAAATKLRSRDPCGETASAVPAGAANMARSREVTAPVLIVEGANDAYFPPPAADMQRSMFTGSGDVTAVTLAGTGHALTLGRTGPQFAARVADWLNRRFPAPAKPAAPAAPHTPTRRARHRRNCRSAAYRRHHRSCRSRGPRFTG